MPVTPTGAPLWTRLVQLADYGGNADKKNYLNRGAIDPLTDVDATQFARLTADSVALARTVPLCTGFVACVDASPMAPVMGGVWDPTANNGDGGYVSKGGIQMATGTRLVPYAGDDPPTGFPSAIRNGNGDVTIIFPDEWSDEYGVSDQFRIYHAIAQIYHPTDPRVVAVFDYTAPATSIRIRCFDGTNNALADAEFSFTVW